jgi:hypothetical protein
MIISPKYKFIFIKTQKTAGSSIERILLDKISDDQDLIFGGMGAEGMNPINLTKDAEHKGAKFIKSNFPDEWKSYYKFTVERNPWDKVVSQYYWVNKREPERTKSGFDSFVLYDKKFSKLGGWNLYTIKNEIVVDYIMQYSNLNNELKYVTDLLKIPYKDELLHTKLKSGFREDINYRSLYTSMSKTRVAELYARPINKFKYSF